MAEIVSGSNHSGGKKRLNKLPTRIDMTPMVSVSFLLMTFFALVSAINRPSNIELSMPSRPSCIDDSQGCGAIRHSRIIQLFLSDHNKMYLVKQFGERISIDSCDFTVTEAMREPFSKLMSEIKRDYGSSDSVIVVIKPMNNSHYENLVGVLDEMIFLKVRRYTVSEFYQRDSLMLLAARNRR